MALGMKVVRPLREAARALANATAIACGTIGERLLALRNLGRSNRSVRMDRLAGVRAAEDSVRRATFEAFRSEVAALEDALGLTLSGVEGQELSLDHTFLRALLVSRAVGSLRCAWLSAAAGYRTQALTLARAALEDYATVRWVMERPEDSELWLWEIVDGLQEPDRRPPPFGTMFERVGEEVPEFTEVLKDVYGRLSEAAHPRARGLQLNVEFAAGSEGAEHSADLSPIFHEPRTAACLHHLLLIAGLLLGAALALYVEGHGESAEADDEFVAECWTVRDRILDANGRIRPLTQVAAESDAG